MDFRLQGWAGDHAGKVVGRRANRALVALSGPAPKVDEIAQWLSVKQPHWTQSSILIYYVIAQCLTPGSINAEVQDIDLLEGNVLSVRVKQSTNDADGAPWKPGVHLFSISILYPNPSINLSAFTTVIVPTS